MVRLSSLPRSAERTASHMHNVDMDCNADAGENTVMYEALTSWKQLSEQNVVRKFVGAKVTRREPRSYQTVPA